MTVRRPRYSKEEFRRLGDEIYERDLKRLLEPGETGKFVAIDIESGEYEVDADMLAASDRLRSRVSDAQIWFRRIGYRYVTRIGLGSSRSADRP